MHEQRKRFDMTCLGEEIEGDQLAQAQVAALHELVRL
jgi:hypothetical protein